MHKIWACCLIFVMAYSLWVIHVYSSVFFSLNQYYFWTGKQVLIDKIKSKYVYSQMYLSAESLWTRIFTWCTFLRFWINILIISTKITTPLYVQCSLMLVNCHMTCFFFKCFVWIICICTKIDDCYISESYFNTPFQSCNLFKNWFRIPLFFVGLLTLFLHSCLYDLPGAAIIFLILM